MKTKLGLLCGAILILTELVSPANVVTLLQQLLIVMVLTFFMIAGIIRFYNKANYTYGKGFKTCFYIGLLGLSIYAFLMLLYKCVQAYQLDQSGLINIRTYLYENVAHAIVILFGGGFYLLILSMLLPALFLIFKRFLQ